METVRVKVLTIKQPWASLVVRGIKRNETRKYHTKIRGELFIHCSKTIDANAKALIAQNPFNRFIDNPDSLPTGKIIGLVNVVACRTVEEMLVTFRQNPDPAAGILEYQLGDYSPGRFAWVLDSPVAFELEDQIPAMGALGIWYYKMPVDIYNRFKAAQ
jgi:activating signal cointegrator 1